MRGFGDPSAAQRSVCDRTNNRILTSESTMNEAAYRLGLLETAWPEAALNSTRIYLQIFILLKALVATSR